MKLFEHPDFEQHPGLSFFRSESQTIGGFGRNDRFEYVQRFAGTGDIRNRVFVESGSASGREPTDRIRIQSYVGQFLGETGVSLGAEDEGPFDMRLLHFRRTFVEKTFAKSDALFPPDSLAAALSAEYESQCRVMCFGAFPFWSDVQSRLEVVRDLF